MGVEIERKFLVVSDAWRREVVRSTRLRQGYICSGAGRTVRVRIAGEAAFLTIKGPADAAGVSRDEWEYAIDPGDALRMLETICDKPQIDKVRHEVAARLLGPGGAGAAGAPGAHAPAASPAGASATWEIDEFLGDNAPLVVAEIELPSADAPFERPAWLGAEVSADTRYRNSFLAAKPYGTWGGA